MDAQVVDVSLNEKPREELVQIVERLSGELTWYVEQRNKLLEEKETLLSKIADLDRDLGVSQVNTAGWRTRAKDSKELNLRIQARLAEQEIGDGR